MEPNHESNSPRKSLMAKPLTLRLANFPRASLGFSAVRVGTVLYVLTLFIKEIIWGFSGVCMDCGQAVIRIPSA